MKKIILLSVSLFTFSLLTQAQCDKKVTWVASKAEFLAPDGKVDDTKNEKVVVEISGKEVKLTHGGHAEDVLKGAITELSCLWTKPYKNGKTTFKTLLEETSGDTKDAIVTIEGKDGKITITIVFESNNGRMLRITVDSYKETS